MSLQTLSLDERTFLQTSLKICERLFQESPLSSTPFTIMDIEELAKRHAEELENNGYAMIITGPFTMLISKDSHDYKVRLAIPNSIPKGLVFDRLHELRKNIYMEFNKKGMHYSD